MGRVKTVWNVDLWKDVVAVSSRLVVAFDMSRLVLLALFSPVSQYVVFASLRVSLSVPAISLLYEYYIV